MNIDIDQVWTLKSFVSRNSYDAQPSELHDIYKVIEEVEKEIYRPKERINNKVVNREVIYSHHLQTSNAKG